MKEKSCMKKKTKHNIILLLCVALTFLFKFLSNRIWFTDHWVYSEYLDYLSLICMIVVFIFTFR